jgi:uncharacterized protein (DUF305 family)
VNIAAMSVRQLAVLVAIAVVSVAAGMIVATGGSSDDVPPTAASGPDLAFVNEMQDHHDVAIKMALTARRRGESRFVRGLAGDIVREQRAEIATLNSVRRPLIESGAILGELGVPDHLRGVERDAKKLTTASPFDRTFIDVMVLHHQGAIRMARAQLVKGQNERLRRLARQIIATQSREIRAMNAHRRRVFGAPSPAGGVPTGKRAA